jgi:hypothetical protein
MEGTKVYTDHHQALQCYHRHADEQAAAALDRVCVLRIEGREVDIGPAGVQI